VTSNVERIVATELRAILTSSAAEVSVREDSQLFGALEFFIPEVMCQLHEHWKCEEIDGFFPHAARKIGNRAIELAGMCILCEDQTGAPFHLRMSYSLKEDVIDWMESRVGVPGKGRGAMQRVALWSKQWTELGMRAAEDPDDIDWVYDATYGDRPVA